jgi:cellulose synthase (UDP-forming)
MARGRTAQDAFRMDKSALLREAFGWLRAPVPAPALPAAETPIRRSAIRGIALAALAVSAVYLLWRVMSTIDLAVWWVSVPMLVLEIHATLALALSAFSLWDVDAAPEARALGRTKLKIAVVVPTVNEGIEILIPTIAAAAAMRVRHQTWVLDDGARPEVKKLARELGVKYLARAEHEHGRAGNLNDALSVIKADLVAVLDADHVADPAFLERTVAYFDDPQVALVQTPQEFYNRDSFEHDAVAGDGERFHEQALVQRMVGPGRNRWAAATWSGSGAVLRVAALQAVGGVATETVTEDVHTTVRLHRQGWKTVYHNQVLSRGLAAADADTYQAQRLRRGTGAMQVLRLERPLWAAGLTLPQRVSYAAALLTPLDAWRTLGFMILPIVVVVTGAVPVRADPLVFILAFGLTYAVQQLAFGALSRGCYRPILSIVFGLVRMTPNLRASRSLITGTGREFPVTPKGRVSDDRAPVRAPLPLRLLLTASVAAAMLFALVLAGGRTLDAYALGWSAVALAWLAGNAVLIGLATRRIRSLRYAPERRASVRFEADLPVWVGTMPAETLDVSTTGARVVANRAVPVGDQVTLTFDVDDEVVTVTGTVRSSRPDVAGLTVHGVEFAPGQHAARARLALGLFRTREAPLVDRAAAPAPAAIHHPTPQPA